MRRKRYWGGGGCIAVATGFKSFVAGTGQPQSGIVCRGGIALSGYLLHEDVRGFGEPDSRSEMAHRQPVAIGRSGHNPRL